MANIARDIFKAYDIRGIVGKTALNLCHQAGAAQTAVAAECDAGNAFFGGFGGNGFAD